MADAQHPLALFDVEPLIDEEDRAIRDTVRQVVDEKVRAELAEWYEAGSLPVRARWPGTTPISRRTRRRSASW